MSSSGLRCILLGGPFVSKFSGAVVVTDIGS